MGADTPLTREHQRYDPGDPHGAYNDGDAITADEGPPDVDDARMEENTNSEVPEAATSKPTDAPGNPEPENRPHEHNVDSASDRQADQDTHRTNGIERHENPDGTGEVPAPHSAESSNPDSPSDDTTPSTYRVIETLVDTDDPGTADTSPNEAEDDIGVVQPEDSEFSNLEAPEAATGKPTDFTREMPADRPRGRERITADDRRSGRYADIRGVHPRKPEDRDQEIPRTTTKELDPSYRDAGPDDTRPTQDRAEQTAGKESAEAGERPDSDRAAHTDNRPQMTGPHLQEAVDSSQRPPGEPLYPTLVDLPMRETLTNLVAELDLTIGWNRLIELRISRVELVVDRMRKLPAVRANPNLVAELDTLRLSDPDTCLDTVGRLLSEILKLRSAPDASNDFDKRIRALDTLVDKAGQIQPKAMVAPDARGHIDGRMPAEPVLDVEVRDSVGVMWGDYNRLRVEHMCVVKHPVIEVAELIDMDDGEPVFDWSAWRFTPTAPDAREPTAVGVVETTLRRGSWANIWNCTGITIGDRNTLELTYVYQMTSCRVNLVPLLRDPRVRAELAQCRDDSPEHAREAREARRRLPATVAKAVQAIDVNNLVSEEEVATLAAKTRQPQVRKRGSGLVITHGIGVALGIAPTVSWSRTTRIDPIRVR